MKATFVHYVLAVSSISDRRPNLLTCAIHPVINYVYVWFNFHIMVAYIQSNILDFSSMIVSQKYTLISASVKQSYLGLLF